jgi:hypothetical protein
MDWNSSLFPHSSSHKKSIGGLGNNEHMAFIYFEVNSKNSVLIRQSSPAKQEFK